MVLLAVLTVACVAPPWHRFFGSDATLLWVCALGDCCFLYTDFLWLEWLGKINFSVQQVYNAMYRQSWRGVKTVPQVPRLRKYGEYGSLWAARTRVGVALLSRGAPPRGANPLARDCRSVFPPMRLGCVYSEVLHLA